MPLVVTAPTKIETSDGLHDISAHTFDSVEPMEIVSADPRVIRRAVEQVFTGSAHSVGPYSQAEISGFWPSVREELFMGSSDEHKDDLTTKILATLQLEKLMERDPKSLSGGETAKVVLASHFLLNPSILTVDGLLEEIDIETRHRLSEYLLAGNLSTLFVGVGPLSLPGRRIQWNLDSDVVMPASGVPEVTSDIWWRTALAVELLGPEKPLLRYMGFEGRALSCRRGGRLIFHDLSFSASAGSISLILGPNGSGKTTLIECIAGILPFKGDFVLDNRDFTKLSSKAVAYAPQDADEDVIEKSMFDEISLSARAGEVENLLLQCSVPREVWTGELAGNIALKKVASVIAAIARGRELCLLDEPTLSCNWAQKQWIVNAINKYRSDGGTVLISSHDSMFLELLARSICI